LVRVRADFPGYRGCLDGRRFAVSVISRRLHAADRNHFHVWPAMRTQSAVAGSVPVCQSSVPNCSPRTRRLAPLTQPVRHNW
jgi:hypothetical protein